MQLEVFSLKCPLLKFYKFFMSAESIKIEQAKKFHCHYIRAGLKMNASYKYLNAKFKHNKKARF